MTMFCWNLWIYITLISIKSPNTKSMRRPHKKVKKQQELNRKHCHLKEKYKNQFFHHHNYNMILPCRLLKQGELVSTDSTASHSNCPVGMLLVDSFYNTSLQHPSFLGTDICMPATEEQKENRTERI